jgi:hypothetical protein
MVGVISAPRPESRLFHHLFAEGFALMRERLPIYAVMAAICAGSAAVVFGHVHLLEKFATGDVGAVIRTPPVNVVLLSTLFAIFFVLPSALRRLDTNFRMTFWRGVITISTILAVGVATDLGYAAAFIPGLIIGVLLSQSLINALLHTGERANARDAAKTVVAAIGGSFRLTRDHFVTTLGILAVSLVILGIPFFVGLVAMLVLDVLDPRSLVLTAPGLFLTFIYFECVRYMLIVRWYRRLDAARAPPQPAAPAVPFGVPAAPKRTRRTA